MNSAFVNAEVSGGSHEVPDLLTCTTVADARGRFRSDAGVLAHGVGC
jgi:hypothetical protein